ncbi:hypothetical protein, partial [Aeromonas sp. R6-2]
ARTGFATHAIFIHHNDVRPPLAIGGRPLSLPVNTRKENRKWIPTALKQGQSAIASKNKKSNKIDKNKLILPD